MINATITRDDPTCKLLNPPSFPLSRAVGEDYHGGRTVRAVWNLRGMLLLPRKNGRQRRGGRKRETHTQHTHTRAPSAIDTIVYNIWHSNVARDVTPFDDIDGVCRLLLRARLSQTIRLSCVSDSFCTPQPLKIPGVKELCHFVRNSWMLLVHRTPLN